MFISFPSMLKIQLGKVTSVNLLHKKCQAQVESLNGVLNSPQIISFHECNENEFVYYIIVFLCKNKMRVYMMNVFILSISCSSLRTTYCHCSRGFVLNCTPHHMATARAI